MGHVISIANEKGGVAKTTTAAALGSILSNRGFRVILIDLDPQGDLTTGLNIDPEDRNIYDCLFTHKKMRASKVNKNLVLVGGDPRMKPANFEKAGSEDPQYKYTPLHIFKPAMDEVMAETDYIILDCPPNVDAITTNAMAVSDYVLIPTEAHRYSINGVRAIKEIIEGLIKGNVNPSLSLLGILITRYRSNTAIHTQMAKALREKYGDDIFSNVIKENITLQEVSHEGQEIVKYDKDRQLEQLVKSSFTGMTNYESATDELLKRIKNSHGEKV